MQSALHSANTVIKYSYIETGQQQLTDDILIKLANFYNVSIDYLLRQTANPKRNL